PGGGHQCLCDAAPAELEAIIRPEEQAADPEVLRKLQVGIVIADDGRGFPVQYRVGQVSRQQSCVRFATAAAVGRAVRAEKDLVERHALALEDGHYVPVAELEIRRGKR